MMSGSPLPPDGIAHTIQIALAPSFLLTAIGAILALLAGRLGRVVDRSRWIEANYAPKGDPRHGYHLEQLRWIDLRMRYANRALILCTLSGMLVCIEIAGLFLAAMFNLALGRIMAVAFIVAMALLISGLTYFLYEVRLSIHATRIQDELLDRDG